MPDLLAIGLAILSTLVASSAMILLKKASGKELRKLHFDFHFLGGGFLFVVAVILIILALKLEALSVVFPVTALTYVWVMLLSHQFLAEKINKWKVVAVVLIISGMLLAIF